MKIAEKVPRLVFLVLLLLVLAGIWVSTCLGDFSLIRRDPSPPDLSKAENACEDMLYLKEFSERLRAESSSLVEDPSWKEFEGRLNRFFAESCLKE